MWNFYLRTLVISATMKYIIEAAVTCSYAVSFVSVVKCTITHLELVQCLSEIAEIPGTYNDLVGRHYFDLLLHAFS